MIREIKVKPNNLGKYFKGIDLKGRLSVIESAQVLLEVQNGDNALLTDASVSQKEKEMLEIKPHSWH